MVHDYDEIHIVDEDVQNGKSNWLIPLLLVPIFFVLGWFANDFARVDPDTQELQQQYGIVIKEYAPQN